MSLQLDLQFSYKNVFRFLSIHKCNFFSNSLQLPHLDYIYIYFSIFNNVDLDDVSSFNYFYLFKFFFGRKSFFSKITSRFHLGVTYFYFSIFSFFFNGFSFFGLCFFINDLLGKSSSNFSSHSIISLGLNFFVFRFFDMNLFLEKKTNMGLFNLNHGMNLKLAFSCNDFFSCFFFLDFFKIYN
jgi:hypothetical protein